MKDEGYIIKIHVKDAIVVSMPIKFSKKFHRGIYANKIHVKDNVTEEGGHSLSTEKFATAP